MSVASQEAVQPAYLCSAPPLSALFPRSLSPGIYNRMAVAPEGEGRVQLDGCYSRSDCSSCLALTPYAKTLLTLPLLSVSNAVFSAARYC